MSITNVFKKIGAFFAMVWGYIVRGFIKLWGWIIAGGKLLWAGIKKVYKWVKKVIYEVWKRKWLLCVAVAIGAVLLLTLCTRGTRATDYGAARVERDIRSAASSTTEIVTDVAELGETIDDLQERSERVTSAIESAKLRVSIAARAIHTLEGLTHEAHDLLRLSAGLNQDARSIIQRLQERYTNGDQEIDEE